MKPFLLSFLLFPLFCAPLHGSEEKRTCRILFPARPADAPARLHLFDGQKSREVELPGMNFSQVYELPSGPLTLTLLASAPADPKNLPPGSPTVIVPESTTHFYLIITTDPDNEVIPMSMRIVSAEGGELQPGQTLWLNLTDFIISGKLADQALLIQPQSTAQTEPPRADAGDYSVTMAFTKPEQDTAQPICETRWYHNPDSRGLGVIQITEGERLPRVIILPDYRP